MASRHRRVARLAVPGTNREPEGCPIGRILESTFGLLDARHIVGERLSLRPLARPPVAEVDVTDVDTFRHQNIHCWSRSLKASVEAELDANNAARPAHVPSP